MGAEAIQKKLDKAHKKVGLKLGETFGIYRPVMDVGTLNQENWIADAKSTFTVNDAYTATLNWEIPVWTCYTDAAQVQEGDFLFNPDSGKTYIIINRQALLPVLALECPHRASIQTVGYANNGTGFAPGATTYFAQNIPGFMQAGSLVKAGSYPGVTNSVTGMRKATFITSVINTDTLIGSILTDGFGFRGNIISYDYSAIGRSVKITAQEMDTPN